MTCEALLLFYIWLYLHGCNPYGGILWHDAHYIHPAMKYKQVLETLKTVQVQG